MMCKYVCRVEGKETRRGGLSCLHAKCAIYGTGLSCMDPLEHRQQPRNWEVEWI